MQLDLERNGIMHGYAVPDSIPPELDGFPWPPGIAEAVAASDAAHVRVQLAAEEWRDASDALQHSAPKVDDDALRAASGQARATPAHQP
jgi:hypothetical protein